MKVYIDWPNACATLVTGICIDNSRVCVCIFFLSSSYFFIPLNIMYIQLI